MLKSKSLPILAGVAALVLAAGLATPASATIVTVSPAPSPQPVAGISGIDSVSFSPTPATTLKIVTGTDYTNDFLPQDTTTVGNGIATVFGVPAPTLTADLETINSNPFTESVPAGFNYAAIHQDSGELVFFYSTSQTTFTLEGFQNGSASGNLSNARFYSSVPAPVIGHGLVVLLAVGGVLSGSKLLEGLKKRQMHAT
jgi:hypothetical protein